MKYETVWCAVDNLAKSLGLSPSGLAKKSGLDATTFNKSKRKRPDGKNRWPSLDSLNKVLEFCNLSFEEFYKYGESVPTNNNLNAIPYLKISAIAQAECCKDKTLDTSNWEMFCFPDGSHNLYALEIDTTKYAPLYKSGTLIVLTKNSEIRRNTIHNFNYMAGLDFDWNFHTAVSDKPFFLSGRREQYTSSLRLSPYFMHQKYSKLSPQRSGYQIGIMLSYSGLARALGFK